MFSNDHLLRYQFVLINLLLFTIAMAGLETRCGFKFSLSCRVPASGVVTENRASTFSRRRDRARGETETACLTASPLNPALETSRWSFTVPLIHRDQRKSRMKKMRNY